MWDDDQRDLVVGLARKLADRMGWRGAVPEPNAMDRRDYEQHFCLCAVEAARRYDRERTDAPEFRMRYVLKAMHNERRTLVRDRLSTSRVVCEIRDVLPEDATYRMDDVLDAREVLRTLRARAAPADVVHLERVALNGGESDWDPSSDSTTRASHRNRVYRARKRARSVLTQTPSAR